MKKIITKVIQEYKLTQLSHIRKDFQRETDRKKTTICFSFYISSIEWHAWAYELIRATPADPLSALYLIYKGPDAKKWLQPRPHPAPDR
jgi:hypothetical protein